MRGRQRTWLGLLAGACCLFPVLLDTVPSAAATQEAHRLVVSATRSGQRLTVRIANAPVRGKCILHVTASQRRAAFTVWRVEKSRVAKIVWSVPKGAQGGIWSLAATCMRGDTRWRARIKIRWPGKGSGLLVAGSSGGKGGGSQSCQPIVEGGSGQVCFIGDPFASYGRVPGEDIGQCTWYAAGMRPDLDGITTGNAANWLTEARGRVPEGTVPVVGAIAVNTKADGGVGHVAYVAAVQNGGATLILDEANLQPPQHPAEGGVYLNITTPASDFQGYIYGGPAGNGPGSSGGPPVETTPPGGVLPGLAATVGVIQVDGTFIAKEGVGGTWVTEDTDARNIGLADSPGGPYLGVVQDDGTLLLKQGLFGTWTTEDTEVQNLSITNDAAGPYLAAVQKDGTLLVKQGIFGTWTTEDSNVATATVVDAAGGSIIGALQTDGTFVVKQGIGGTWTTEDTEVGQIAIANDPGGPIIGAVQTDGSFIVKQGVGGTWTTEATGIAQASITDDPGGPYIAALQSDGTVLLKQGIGGTWTTEDTQAKGIEVADDPAGPYLGALQNDGTFLLKQGVFGAWTVEDTDANTIEIAR